MLRESLVRGSRERGTWEARNATCAAMLRRRSGAQVRARLGRHLFEAGRWSEALEPLIDGAREARARYSHGEALHFVGVAKQIEVVVFGPAVGVASASGVCVGMTEGTTTGA